VNALINAAWIAECDEPSDKLVLVYLSDRANVNSKAWPHLPTIARQTGLGRRTVIEAMKRIEARGYVTVTRELGCSNSYIIHPVKDALTGAATALVRRTHATGAATAPLPVQPRHQHPNHHGISKGTGKAAPRFKRENWKLLRDEESLTKRIKSEAESCNPDKDLIEALKTERRNIRDEIKGISTP
jgi:DNA-binding transcriptional MocR family regulator